MPKTAKGEPFQGDHFAWVLYKRENGIFYADGRSNTTDVGRHSLCTRDHAAALERVRALDHVKAAERGLIAPPTPQAGARGTLPLGDGGQLFLKYGVSPDTKPASVKRYRAVVEEFVKFARGQGLADWQQVKKMHVQEYARWLDEARHGSGKRPYCKRTKVFERIVLAQILKYLAQEGRIDAVDLRGIRPKKVVGTDAVCFTDEEVEEVVTHCRARPDLAWLLPVVVTLAKTGARISELASLRWEDVDIGDRTNANESWATFRGTKNGRDRRVPLLEDVVEELKKLPRHRDGRVFHGQLGGRLKPDTVRRAFVRDVLKPIAKASTRVSPQFLRGRLHTFRHYFCSTLVRKNVHQQTILAVMGHQSSAMVAHYKHLHDPSLREQVGRLPSLLPKPSMTKKKASPTKDRSNESERNAPAAVSLRRPRHKQRDREKRRA